MADAPAMAVAATPSGIAFGPELGTALAEVSVAAAKLAEATAVTATAPGTAFDTELDTASAEISVETGKSDRHQRRQSLQAKFSKCWQHLRRHPQVNQWNPTHLAIWGVGTQFEASILGNKGSILRISLFTKFLNSTKKRISFFTEFQNSS